MENKNVNGPETCKMMSTSDREFRDEVEKGTEETKGEEPG